MFFFILKEMEEEKNEPLTALEFENDVYKFDKPGEKAFKVCFIVFVPKPGSVT